MSKSSIAAVGLLVVVLAGAPVAHALGWEAVTVALVALPGAVAAVVALDIRARLRERVRRAEAWQRTLERRVEAMATAQERPPARADVPTREDLVGTVGVLQAQYTGRLDRAQRSLDDAVQALRAHLDATTPGETRTTE